jgi:hypothetical protein
MKAVAVAIEEGLQYMCPAAQHSVHQNQYNPSSPECLPIYNMITVGNNSKTCLHIKILISLTSFTP